MGAQDVAEREQVRGRRISGPRREGGGGVRKFGVNRGGHGSEDTKVVHLLEAERELGRTFASDFLGEELALGGGEAFAEGDQRKRNFAAGEIGAEGFADAGFGAEVIGEVVVDLIGDTEVAAEAGGGFGASGLGAGEFGAEETGDAEEFGGLEVDDALVIGEGNVKRAAAEGLDDLAGADAARGFGDGGADFGGGKLRGEVERVGEERITEEDSGDGAEFAGGGAAAAANVGFVHDIVVHERGEVDEFDDGGDADEVGRDDAGAAPAAEKNERGADAFARSVDAVIGHGADLGLKGVELTAQKAVEFGHVRREMSKHAGKGRFGAGRGGGFAVHDCGEPLGEKWK